MYKSNTELIVIDAKATEPISTNVVFWSHDKGTAKMLFQLQKDYVNQTLSEGTIVPICLDFVGGRHIYHAVIEDAVNGIVSIVLEDNILGYVGRVDGSIYIELPDSRSLDTAGRFTFQIKRSPIDEDVPELEDYYWQGFNEIMNQYHGTIATIKFEAKTLLDSLSADVTKVKNDIATANTRIEEINKKIDDNDVFTKAESSANVIYQLVGKEKVRMTFTADFSNKESGSDDKNPHWASAVYGLNELPSPSDFKTELVQLRYDSLKILDGQKTIVNTVAGTANQYPCLEHKWDIVEIIKRELSEDFFVDRGAIDKASQATVAKKIIVSPLESSAWGFGTCPSGNSLKIANHINGVGWQTDQLPPNTTNLVKQITARNTATPSIDDEGFLRTIIYTEASSKTVQSQINVDYGNLVFSIEISMNEHIKSMMAANHVENLATQEEAELGEDNTKTMTPLRTKQLLDSKLLNMVYPIGSIYMSVNSATPATLFGGTWERFSKGRVLVGVDEEDAVLSTAGKQGGSTNPLTAHTHTTRLTTYRVTSGTGSGSVNNLGRATDLGGKMTDEFGSVTSTGDNTDHNNWQPFETVYMWKRTA